MGLVLECSSRTRVADFQCLFASFCSLTSHDVVEGCRILFRRYRLSCVSFSVTDDRLSLAEALKERVNPDQQNLMMDARFRFFFFPRSRPASDSVRCDGCARCYSFFWFGSISGPGSRRRRGCVQLRQLSCFLHETQEDLVSDALRSSWFCRVDKNISKPWAASNAR